MLELIDLKYTFPEVFVLAIQNLRNPALLVHISVAGAHLQVMPKNGNYVPVSTLSFADSTRIAAGLQALARKALDRI